MPSIPPQKPPSERAPRRRTKNTTIKAPDDPPLSNRPSGYSQNPRFRRPIPSTHRPSTVKLNPVIKNGPISPNDALQNYSPLLTNYERSEIMQFPEIYFVGNKSRKIEPNATNRYNIGFDDSSHNYKINIGDHLAYRFEIVSTFGAGAFGQVLKCIDHRTGNKVACKIIVSTEQMHEQGQIEAKILARLNKTESPNIVKAFDFFIFRSHICITFEVLGKNLYEVSQSNGFRPLPIKNVKSYAIQILKALEISHKTGIVHCDLKPENVLICPENKNQVKVIDFGSSCFEGHQKYEYIQSRFYRAPEVMIGIDYGPPMDIWSFALIVVELLTGRPLFPGDDELEELYMIAEVLGNPHPGLVKKGRRRREFFDDSNRLKPQKGRKIRKPGTLTLQQALGSNDPYYVDFIAKCLTWDQNIRFTATQCLQHPWLNIKEIKPQSQRSVGILPDLHH